MTDRPDWHLPVGESLDPARAALIVETFAEDIRRVGRDLRARIAARHPTATVAAEVYAPADLLGGLGYTRNPGLDRIALAHAAYDGPIGPVVVAICLEWETGEIVVVGGEV